MSHSKYLLGLIIFFLSVGYLFLTPQAANAGYLDPGAGSTAVQWIIALVATITKLKDKIITILAKLFRR